MKIYRVSRYRAHSEHDGYTYHSNINEAKKSWKSNDFDNLMIDENEEEINVYDVEISKKGILYFLNCFANHPDNG